MSIRIQSAIVGLHSTGNGSHPLLVLDVKKDDLVEKDDGHTVREKFFEAVPLSDTHAAVILESLKKRIHKEVRVSSVEFVVE